MPEEKNIERQKKILDWLSEKWPVNKRICDICDSSTWTLTEDVTTPVRFNNKNFALGGIAYPQIMVICNNCGQIKCFNAVIAGVIEKEGKNDGK